MSTNPSEGDSSSGTSRSSEGFNNFPKTEFPLLEKAMQSDSRIRGPALSIVLQRYMPPLKTYLIYRRGLRVEEAEDVLHSFIADKILEAKLLRKMDPTRGKFRSFLLTVLDRYLIDWERRKGRVRQVRTQFVGEDLDSIAESGEPPADLFEVEWARETIAEVLRRMEAELEDRRHWEVFRHRVLKPCLENEEPLPYEELVQQLGFASPTQASNALITAKRTFVRVLRDVIGDYEEEAVQEEIRSLWTILSRSHGDTGGMPQ